MCLPRSSPLGGSDGQKRSAVFAGRLPRRQLVVAKHEAVIHALEQHNPDAAVLAIGNHLNDTARTVLARIGD
jgi:DNA-binding GntR family transcriptional regulator